MPSRRLQLREELLLAFSGAADGTPAWVLELREGDDDGFFAHGGPAWTVHEGMGTLVAGIRALLMQALHPGAMAGVHDWSRYRKDPLGRLTGTVRWIVVTTYGSTEQARRETARVMRFHARVEGEYRDNAGDVRAYSAGDQDLVRWVHLAFTDAFLGSHLEWGAGARSEGHCWPSPRRQPRRPSRASDHHEFADAYVADWATAGELMGVEHPPRSEAELRGQLAGFLPHLRRDERVDDVVKFIRKPPLSPRLRRAYGLLFAGAVASLPVKYRRLLGLRRSPLPVKLLTGLALRVAGNALRGSGEKSSPDFALERIERLRASTVA